jgi:hypothetical protein
MSAILILAGSGRHSRAEVVPLQESDVRGSVVTLAYDDPNVKKIMARGVANIYNGNVERARNAALLAAYAEAVSRGAGVDVGSLMLVKNVRQVSDVVMTRSRGFIKSYKIFKEGIYEKDPNKYENIIEAEVVMRGKVQGEDAEGLRLYLELLGNPRILIMLPEKTFGDTESKKANRESDEVIEIDSKDTKVRIKKSDKDARAGSESGGDDDHGSTMQSAEAALAQAFSQYGYQVTTSDDLLSQGLVEPAVLKQAKAGVTAQALKVARAAGADIALLGVIRMSKSVVKPVGVTMTMASAEASAKAMIVSSGNTVQAFHTTERAAAPERLKAYADVLDKVASNVAGTLAWKIPQLLTNDSRQSKLIIHNTNLTEANKIKNGLGNLPGIEAVRFSKLPSDSDHTAEFILMTGFVMMSPDELQEACNSILNKKLSIVKMNKYEVEFRNGRTDDSSPSRKKKSITKQN